MGGAFSSASGGPVTRQQLLDATKNNREFIQKLFNVMLNQLTREDLLKLGDQRTCNKYVFLMADTIQKMFKALKIRPGRDKTTGVIYFEKVEKLTERTPEARTYCLEIAYFYIRIFQIFGALALSILDDPAAGTVLGAATYIEPPALGIGRRPSIPGLEYAMFGGADPASMDKGARAWRLLSNDLEEKEVANFGGRPYDIYKFIGNSDLWLIPDSARHNMRYEARGERLYAKGSVSLIRSSWPRQLRISITSWELTVTAKAQKDIINSKIQKVQKLVVANQADETSDWKVGTSSLTDAIIAKFEEVLRLTEEIEADPRKVVSTGIAYTRPLKADAVAGTSAPLYGVAAGETAQRPLQTKYIIDTMKQLAGGQKTTSFCVARALQLLDAPTLFSPRTAKVGQSGVCLSKFDRLPTSVPESGAPITRVPGLKALDQLFYDAPKVGATDGGTSVEVSERDQYQTMLKLLAATFTGREPTKLSTMDQILAKSPSCPADAAKQYLKVTDPRALKEVLAIVQQMFGRQLAHTRRVVEFLSKKLIMVYREGSGQKVSLHPNILKGGIPEINKLAAEARAVLIDYYKGCEDLYQKGVGKVLDARTQI